MLTNTSEIPMTYRLRVPSNEADDEVEQEESVEFEVDPKSGVLPPNFQQCIKVYTYNIPFHISPSWCAHMCICR